MYSFAIYYISNQNIITELIDCIIVRPDNFIFKSNKYDLTHLETCEHWAVTEHQPEGIQVRVVYTCHCFTEAKNKFSEIETPYNEEGENRHFSVNRHQMSIKLPMIISAAIENARRFKVFTRSDKNGAFNYVILENPKNKTTYSVFFDLAKKPGRIIVMTVKSAYENTNQTSSRDKTNLGTLFDKTMGLRPKKNHKRKKKKK